MKQPPALVIYFLPFLLFISFLVNASPDHDHHDHDSHSESEKHQRDHVEISTQLANQSGIDTRVASGGVLQQTVFLFGQLKPAPAGVSHIRARFPGLIKQVSVQIGKSVNAGETIARVEANDSLRSYDVTSPINGIVIDQHANAGEFSGDQVLFTVANYDQLELDLKVFAKDAHLISTGQSVQVYMEGSTTIAEGTVAYLTAGDGNIPFLTAHVPLDNTAGKLIPGAVIEAAITVAQHNVDILIEKRAVQKIDGQSIVFVKHGDRFDVRPLILGRSNGNMVEVLNGLQPGDHYVVENSFLLKADLEKSGAAHVH